LLIKTRLSRIVTKVHSQGQRTATASTSKMFKHSSKKRTVLKNFQEVVQHDVNYPHRLNFYTTPPLSEITLEEFELWAIDRLYG
jgi:hypothetical protein